VSLARKRHVARRVCAAGPSAQRQANVHKLAKAPPEESTLTAGRYRGPGMIEVQLTASDFQLELYVDESPDFDTGPGCQRAGLRSNSDLRRRLDLHRRSQQLILYT
jgi:hypothetical protein